MNRSARLLAFALAPLTLACATPMDVHVEASADFSGEPTWNWAPRNEPSAVAYHRDLSGMEQEVERAVEQILDERGFRRSQGRADFYASYYLGLRRRDVAVVVPFAARTVSSYHHTGSFLIEGSERTVRSFEEAYLVIGFARSGGPIAWHAALQQRVEGLFDKEVNVAVARVLEAFPYYVPSARPSDRLERLPQSPPCLLAQPPAADPGVTASSDALVSLPIDVAIDADPEACPKG